MSVWKHVTNWVLAHSEYLEIENPVYRRSQLKMNKLSIVNPLAPESDQHPVSPDNNTAALFIWDH